MFIHITRKKHSLFFRMMAFIMVVSFATSLLIPSQRAYAQTAFSLPIPGTMIHMSPRFAPPVLRAVKIYPDNPFQFDFVIDRGDSDLEGEDFKEESNKLVKYFLASLTTPEDDLWVNLSPYEENRIIPDEFGVTEMGRDLLAQDYLLKQLTASLIYPEDELGQKFWDRIYKKAYEKYGTTEVPVNTFNKVWVIPDYADVYETDSIAFVVDSHLKVMIEADYLAFKKNLNDKRRGTDELTQDDADKISSLSHDILKELIIPEIEKEINEGKNFANLRQVYHSLILAAWYKRSLKESILNKIYSNQNKVSGVDVEDKQVKDKIYQKYLEAYKKGVYNYIKEDYDKYTDELIPRKYFSGGFDWDMEEGLRRKRFDDNQFMLEAAQTSREKLAGGDAGSAVYDLATVALVSSGDARQPEGRGEVSSRTGPTRPSDRSDGGRDRGDSGRAVGSILGTDRLGKGVHYAQRLRALNPESVKAKASGYFEPTNVTNAFHDIGMYGPMHDHIKNADQSTSDEKVRALLLGPGSSRFEGGGVSYQAVEIAALLAANADKKSELTVIDQNYGTLQAAINPERYEFFTTYHTPKMEARIMARSLSSILKGASEPQLREEILDASVGSKKYSYKVDAEALRDKVDIDGITEDIEKVKFPDDRMDMIVATNVLQYALATLREPQKFDLFFRLINMLKREGKGKIFVDARVMRRLFEDEINFEEFEAGDQELSEVLERAQRLLAQNGLEVSFNTIDPDATQRLSIVEITNNTPEDAQGYVGLDKINIDLGAAADERGDAGTAVNVAIPERFQYGWHIAKSEFGEGPFPAINYYVRIKGPKTVEDVYGELFRKMQELADELGIEDAYIEHSDIEMDQRTRTLSLTNVKKDPRIPINYYDEISEIFTKHFPGYKVIDYTVEGPGAVLGITRIFENPTITAARDKDKNPMDLGDITLDQIVDEINRQYAQTGKRLDKLPFGIGSIDIESRVPEKVSQPRGAGDAGVAVTESPVIAKRSKRKETFEGKDRVLKALEENMPQLWAEYQQYQKDSSSFSLLRLRDLKEKIYALQKAHFDLWGLKRVTEREGSYITILRNIFPELDLNPYAFSYVFEGKTDDEIETNAKLSVQAAVQRYEPGLWEEYQLFKEDEKRFSFEQVKELKEKFYRLKSAHFRIWGAVAAIDKRQVKNFEERYGVALAKSFPELRLNPHAFTYKYKGKTAEEAKNNGIRSVQAAVERFAPDLWRDYQALVDHPEQFLDSMRKNLRERFYLISYAHFTLWGLGGATNASYFKGPYTRPLQLSFPLLNLRQSGFEKARKTKQNYKWKEGVQTGIRNVQSVLEEQMPEFWQRYQVYRESPNSFTFEEVAELKEKIYQIRRGHFEVWGIDAATSPKSAEYFGGKHSTALIRSLPAFKENGSPLNPFAFHHVFEGETDEKAEQNGIKSVQAAVERFDPLLWREYDVYDKNPSQFPSERRRELKERIYKIGYAHFTAWGLGAALDQRKAPYFKGSYSLALRKSFSKLRFNPDAFSFRFDGKTKKEAKDNGIRSVRAAVERFVPDLWEEYVAYRDNPDKFKLRRLQKLNRRFANLQKAHLEAWRLKGAYDKKIAPYFKGSYRIALQESFPEIVALRITSENARQFRDHLGISRRDLINSVVRVPGFLRKDPALIQDSFRRELGMPKKELGESIVKHPQLAGLNPKRVREEFTRELGITKEDLASAIIRYPQVVSFDPARVRDQIHDELGISRENFTAGIVKHPQFISYDFKRIREEFRDELAFSKDDAARLLMKQPRFGGYSVKDNIKPKLEIIRTLSVRLGDEIHKEDEIDSLAQLATRSALVLQAIMRIADQTGFYIERVSRLDNIYNRLNEAAQRDSKKTVAKLIKEDPAKVDVLIRKVLSDLAKGGPTHAGGDSGVAVTMPEVLDIAERTDKDSQDAQKITASDDGNWISIINRGDKQLTVKNQDSGQIFDLPIKNYGIEETFFSPDNKWIVVEYVDSYMESTQIINLETGTALNTGVDLVQPKFTFSKNGRWLAIKGEIYETDQLINSHGFRLFDLSKSSDHEVSMDLLGNITGRTIFSDDEKLLFVGFTSTKDAPAVFDLENLVDTGLDVGMSSNEIGHVSFSSDSQELFIAKEGPSGVVDIYDTNNWTKRQIETGPRPGGLRKHIAVSDDGRWIFAGNADGDARTSNNKVFDAKTGEQADIEIGDRVRRTYFSPDGEYLVVVDQGDALEKIQVFSLDDGMSIEPNIASDVVRDIHFVEGNKMIVQYPERANVVNLETGEDVSAELTADDYYDFLIVAVHPSDYGKTGIVYFRDGTIEIRNFERNESYKHPFINWRNLLEDIPDSAPSAQRTALQQRLGLDPELPFPSRIERIGPHLISFSKDGRWLIINAPEVTQASYVPVALPRLYTNSIDQIEIEEGWMDDDEVKAAIAEYRQARGLAGLKRAYNKVKAELARRIFDTAVAQNNNEQGAILSLLRVFDQDLAAKIEKSLGGSGDSGKAPASSDYREVFKKKVTLEKTLSVKDLDAFEQLPPPPRGKEFDPNALLMIARTDRIAINEMLAKLVKDGDLDDDDIIYTRDERSFTAKGLLNNALAHFIANSVDAIDERFKSDFQKGEINFRASVQDDQLIIEILDNGTGWDPDALKWAGKTKQRFSVKKRVEKTAAGYDYLGGAGVALYNTQEDFDHVGWTMNLANRDDQRGAKVTLTIPSLAQRTSGRTGGDSGQAPGRSDYRELFSKKVTLKEAPTEEERRGIGELEHRDSRRVPRKKYHPDATMMFVRARRIAGEMAAKLVEDEHLDDDKIFFEGYGEASTERKFLGNRLAWLIANSVDAIDERFKSDFQKGEIDIRAGVQDSQIIIEVLDNGTGFGADELEWAGRRDVDLPSKKKDKKTAAGYDFFGKEGNDLRWAQQDFDEFGWELNFANREDQQGAKVTITIPIAQKTGESDSAGDSGVIPKSDVGGIDFNPNILRLNIQRDENGQPPAINITPQQIPNIKIDGLQPVIINIVPVTNLPLILGVSKKDKRQEISSLK